MDLHNIWIITDTHFRHERMHTLCHRPKDYNEQIIKSWRENVQPDDLVIHLGDVAWPQGWEEGIIKELPGRKILVRGNHDATSLPTLMTRGFDVAVDSMSMTLNGLDILFTHAPAINHQHDINVHGHLHQKDLEVESTGVHWCCSLERQGYKVQKVADLWKTWRKLANKNPKVW